MGNRRLLVWGTTYPEFSKKYYETVCTGAYDPEVQRLIRIYPITLRYAKEPIKTYDWIEAEVSRNTADFRPESHRIQQDSIQIVGHVGTDDGWAERKKLLVHPTTTFQSVEALRTAEAANHTSLGLVRPRQILGFNVRRKSPGERDEWEQQREHAVAQRDLFVDVDSKTKDLAFMPVQYRVRFLCADPACTNEHQCSILDWQIYVLSRREFARGGAAQAEKSVFQKLEEVCDMSKKDLWFFMGNTMAHTQNFMVVGFFYPPIQKQGSLFG